MLVKILLPYKEFVLLEQIKHQYNDLLLKIQIDEAKKGEYIEAHEALNMLNKIHDTFFTYNKFYIGCTCKTLIFDRINAIMSSSRKRGSSKTL